ncbi:MAG: ATP-binding protein [Pelovirga sp.]
MKFFDLGSIRRNLTFLVVIAVLPALVILFYSGMEQRRTSIENARLELFALTRSMADAQQEITSSTRQMLSTIALLPMVRNLDLAACEELFAALLHANRDYENFTLVDPQGWVLASGKPFGETNLGDRKHVAEALQTRDFSVGEYVIARVGGEMPAFGYAYPVTGPDNEVVAVLTALISLTRYERFHDALSLPDNSFVALTDHNGIRLFYYPTRDTTNPLGQPINEQTWQRARTLSGAGSFSGRGSDGIERIIAFEPVLLDDAHAPYLYVWAGVPEQTILAAASESMTRNLLLMFLVAIFSLSTSWLIARNTLIRPIAGLVALTRDFSAGRFVERSTVGQRPCELGDLSRAFHAMALTRQRAEADLQRQTAELKRRNAELERFNYTLSHDLKTPLVTIEAFLGFLEEDLAHQDTAAVSRASLHIRSAVSQISRRLDSLLQLYRAGLATGPATDMPFTELVQQALAPFTQRIAKHHVIVRIVPDELTLHGDQGQLEELWRILIDNALTYMGNQEEPLIEIGVQSDADDDGVIFYVRDNGTGIEPQYQEKIFKLFDQLDKTSGGSGLGLALAQLIVEQNGGRIWVTSAGTGLGSCFYFTLPESCKQAG